MTAGGFRKADVVVVGGGVLGTACAEQLARQRLSVALVERGHLASGASGSCQSGIGYGLTMDDDELAYFQAATKAYRELADDAAIDYRLDGALVLSSPGDEDALRAKAVALAGRGLPCTWLDGPALREAEPALSSEVVGAALLADTAQVSPMRVTVELATRAQRHGAEILTSTTVSGIDTTGGRVVGVETTRGRIATETVVIAAGAWSREVAELVGLQPPVWPLKGHVLVTEPTRRLLNHYLSEARYDETVKAMLEQSVSDSGPPASTPRIATVLQNLPSGSVLIGSSREFAGFDRTVDRGRLAQLGASARRVVPALGHSRVIRTYAGLRPWTPDGRPLIGPTEQQRGIAFATGHGGEGNTGALVSARLLADLLVGHAPELAVGRFSPDRFALRSANPRSP
jgi:sarcosine oxidase subunit beta